MPRPGVDHEGVLGCVQMRERGGRLSTGNDVRAISLEQTDSRNSGDYVLRTGRACRIMSHGGGKVARTLLCIVPHPDDAEFSAGGFLARMSAEGVRVLLAVATDGSKGSFEPVEAVQPKHGEAPRPNLAQIRHAETCNAARVLGAEEPIFLGYEDFMLDTLPLGELREKIVYLIRKYKPDILVSQDPSGPLDPHPDHRALAWAALEAAHFSQLPRLYPEHLAASLEPWFVVEKYFYNPDPARINCIIDIADTFERKIAALTEHRSQIDFLVEDIVMQLRLAGIDPAAVAGTGSTHSSFEQKCTLVAAALRRQAEETAKPAGLALAEAFCYERFHPMVEAIAGVWKQAESPEKSIKHCNMQ